MRSLAASAAGARSPSELAAAGVVDAMSASANVDEPLGAPLFPSIAGASAAAEEPTCVLAPKTEPASKERSWEVTPQTGWPVALLQLFLIHAKKPRR
jgi:hypothetical protein